MSETTTKTVTINYDDEGRVIREVTVVVVEVANALEGGAAGGGDRLAVDAHGYVWWHREDGNWSMVRTNPDNSPIPQPVTYYEATR